MIAIAPLAILACLACCACALPRCLAAGRSELDQKFGTEAQLLLVGRSSASDAPAPVRVEIVVDSPGGAPKKTQVSLLRRGSSVGRSVTYDRACASMHHTREMRLQTAEPATSTAPHMHTHGGRCRRRHARKGRKWEELHKGLGKALAHEDERMVLQTKSELDSARKRLIDASREAKAA